MTLEPSISIQSVSQLTASIRHLLEGTYRFVHVKGEISDCRTPFSGHTYFVLKDGGAQIRCVLFKNQKRYLDKPLKNGQEIICHGRISVYEQRGEYQIIVDTVDQAGIGALQEKFEQLKQKLQTEGLFDENSKKTIPPYPKHVIVITSATGAALQDFLKIYRHISPPCRISIFPVAVQGQGAADDVRAAIMKCNKQLEADILILCRGGGSIEDLWAFNDEELARTIASSLIPVVTGVGHEIDFTIADFCADMRCPTPTAAASHVFSAYSQIQQRLTFLERKIIREMENTFSSAYRHFEYASKKLALIENRIENYFLKADYFIAQFVSAFQARLHILQQQTDNFIYKLHRHSPQNRLQLSCNSTNTLEARLKRAMLYTIEKKEAEFKSRAALLDTVSPLATLGRGYSITRKKTGDKETELITNAKQVDSDDIVEITLHKGTIDCKVLSTDD